MQSELLYRRYLGKGDIFIHADLEGALPMIVKNRTGNTDAPISPSTLSQAGNMCVATSTAWDSKAVMSAWWVHAHQVSKTAQMGGGILPTGRFEVKGEKNFLAPSQLVLGFAVLWQISQDSVKNHKQLFEAGDVPVGNMDKKATEVTPETITGEATTDTAAVEEAPTASQNENPQDEQPVDEAAGEEEAEDEEDEEEDQTPARNPLQRGDSELPVNLDQDGESEAEDEDEDKAELELEPSQEDQAADETLSTTQEDTNSTRDERKQLTTRDRRQGKFVHRPGEDESATPRIPPTRGKKAKDKRAAAKYAHQDDEERELALRLLGSNKNKVAKAARAAEAKAQREREAEAQRVRRRAQHERAAEAERKRQALFAEDGGDEYNEETAAAEAADLSWLPALVGTPSPDDEILAAIPVCAPWAALGRYKFKVKLQPGAVKKGKAVKEIVGRWVAETTTGKVKKDHAEDLGISRVDAEKLREREGELIKGWKETEVINTLPVGKVRIMTPGSGSAGGGEKGKGGGSGGKGGRGGGKGGKKK